MRINIGIESSEYGSIGSCYKTPLHYFSHMETSSDKLKKVAGFDGEYLGNRNDNYNEIKKHTLDILNRILELTDGVILRYGDTQIERGLKTKEYLNEHWGSGVIRMNNGFGDNFGSELFWNVTAG